MSSPLDRIEAKMQNRMFGQWPVIHPDTVLALVNIAKAAERVLGHGDDLRPIWQLGAAQDWQEWRDEKELLREALAALMT